MQIEKYLEFEELYSLVDREVLGLHYWYFCRIFMFFYIQSEYDKTANIVSLTYKKKDKRIFLNRLSNYIKLRKNTDILFISDPRRFLIDNEYYSVFSDPIERVLSSDYKTLTIEEPSWVATGYDDFPPHFVPPASCEIFYVDFSEMTYRLKRYMFVLAFPKSVEKIEKELKYLYGLVNEYFDVDISNTQNEFLNIILYFLLMERTYDRLINRINPKVIVSVYRPTYFKTLIQGIGKKQGIPVIELQHGSINRNEPMNKKLNNKFHDCYQADYLFCFGHRLVNKEYMCESKIKYIGFPFFEVMNSQLTKPSCMNENKRYILIVSQSTIGDDLSRFASELADILMNDSQYMIVFKYHPNELCREYSCLNKKNIIQIRTLDNYISQFQKYAFCQIGVYSTAIYEGLAFRLPTFIIKTMYGADTMINNLSHIQKGVYYVESPKDTVSVFGRIEQPEEKDINDLWEADSIDNFKNEIKKIIHGA